MFMIYIYISNQSTLQADSERIFMRSFVVCMHVSVGQCLSASFHIDDYCRHIDTYRLYAMFIAHILYALSYQNSNDP